MHMHVYMCVYKRTYYLRQGLEGIVALVTWAGGGNLHAHACIYMCVFIKGIATYDRVRKSCLHWSLGQVVGVAGTGVDMGVACVVCNSY